MQLEGKERYDKKHGIWKEQAIGSIILLHNTWRKRDILQKLAFKWLGSYGIYNVVEGKGTYMLEELDRSHLAGTFARNRLKKFHPCQQLHLYHTPNLDQEVVPTLEDFLAADNGNLSKISDNFSDWIATISCFLGTILYGFVWNFFSWCQRTTLQ